MVPDGPPLLRRLCPAGELRRGGDLLPLRDATGAPCAAGSEPWRADRGGRARCLGDFVVIFHGKMWENGFETSWNI